MDLSLKTEVFSPAEDQSWLGSAHGTTEADPVTLDVSLFSVVTFPDGFLPSGLVLGKITATGKYGPYGANVNEQQLLTIDATGGTYTLSFDGEGPTAAIAEAATAATVKAALETLSNINVGDIAVTGSAGGPYTIEFTGQYAGDNVPAITTDGALLTGGAGTAVITTPVAGGSAVSDGRQTAAGMLFTTVAADDIGSGTSDVSAALYWHGEVIEANLPTGHGLDASARDTLKHIRFVA